MPSNEQFRIPPPDREPLLMDELIVNPPGWLLHSGMTIIAITLAMGLSLTWLIKYPDKIEAPFTLTSENPPVEIVSIVSAPVDTILKQDQAEVKQGDLILVMESAVKWQSAEQLIIWLNKIRDVTDALPFKNLQTLENLAIGEIQIPYASLVQKIKELQYFLAQDITEEKVAAICSEIKKTQDLNRSLRKQKEIFVDEFQLVDKDYQRNLTLNQDKLVSDKEFESTKGQWLQQKRSLENMRSNIIQNEIRQKQLLTQKLELQEGYEQELNLRHVTIQQEIEKVLEALRSWQENYLVKAPISGMLSYREGLTTSLFISNTQSIATVLPQSGKGRIIGRAYVPPMGTGKISIKDQVQIRLDAYQDKEYGILLAQVDKIAPLPTRDDDGQTYHLMEMYLNNTLTTTYDLVIPFKQQISGVATIITKEKRLLERFFENILDIFKNN